MIIVHKKSYNARLKKLYDVIKFDNKINSAIID